MQRRLFCLGCTCVAASRTIAQPCGRTMVEAREAFEVLVRAGAVLRPAERIAFVNAAVNTAVAFGSDAGLGAVDAWLTPVETLARGCGDCEDIAIAKFFLLLAGGTEVAGVRLLYARRRDPAAPAAPRPHLVALVRCPQADPLVLDNANPAALPMSQRLDLEPVFSFDRALIWAGVDGAERGCAPTRLHAWRDLLARVAAQDRQLAA